MTKTSSFDTINSFFLLYFTKYIVYFFIGPQAEKLLPCCKVCPEQFLMPQTLEDVSTSLIEIKKIKKIKKEKIKRIKKKKEMLHTHEEISTHGFMDSM